MNGARRGDLRKVTALIAIIGAMERRFVELPLLVAKSLYILTTRLERDPPSPSLHICIRSPRRTAQSRPQLGPSPRPARRGLTERCSPLISDVSFCHPAPPLCPQQLACHRAGARFGAEDGEASSRVWGTLPPQPVGHGEPLASASALLRVCTLTRSRDPILWSSPVGAWELEAAGRAVQGSGGGVRRMRASHFRSPS